MYIVQHLKTNLYGVMDVRNTNKIMWHSNKNFATRYDSKENLEYEIKKREGDRDKMRIVYVPF